MYLQSNVEFLLDQKKLNPNEAAPIIGIPQPTLFRIHGGITKEPKRETLEKIAEWAGVTSSDLMNKDLRGGVMIPVEPWDSDTPLDDDEVAIPFFKDFRVACGTGTIGEALSTETRRLRLSKSTLRAAGVDQKSAVAMTAHGDSMKGKFSNNDTVYVDISKNTIKDGKIFAFEHGGLFKFKRLYSLPMGGVRVVSENAEEYPEERYTAQEIIDQDFKIIGWAFSWQAMDSW